MGALRQLGSGIIYGLVSVMLVVGGLSLALAESYTAPPPAPTSSLPIVPETLTPTLAGPTSLPTSTPQPTSTPLPPTNCPPPPGWVRIYVEPYDTVESLAFRFRVWPYQLVQANCLLTNSLAPGFAIYVPPPPPPPTAVPCGAPYGWIRNYIVRPGDTLYSIAVLFQTDVYELERANCNFSGYITAGSWLWVPNVPTATAAPSQTPTVIIINEFSTSTPLPTNTEIPTGTATFTPTATTTPTPTYTVTSLPSPTLTPTVTAFPTQTVTP
jgi:hypothetical protein